MTGSWQPGQAQQQASTANDAVASGEAHTTAVTQAKANRQLQGEFGEVVPHETTGGQLARRLKTVAPELQE